MGVALISTSELIVIIIPTCNIIYLLYEEEICVYVPLCK